MNQFRQIKRKKFYNNYKSTIKVQTLNMFGQLKEEIREVDDESREEKFMDEISNFLNENASEVISINTVVENGFFDKNLIMVYYYEK